MALRASPAEAIMVDHWASGQIAEARERQTRAMIAAEREAQQAQTETAPSALLEWAERHRRIDGQPFSLARFEPLRAIYADDHPHIVIIKPAQRGVSELAINYSVFAMDRGAEVWTEGQKDGLNVAYVFPTQQALGDFSKERISGLTKESPYLAALFSGDDDFNAVTFKQVRESFLYLRGGWSESALLSFAADVLILDEYDRMDASAVALARRRMNASLVRRELDVSTPTLPGHGIHALYLQSDQRVYEQWHRCGSWVTFDFWRDVRVAGQPYELSGGRGWRTWPAEVLRASDVTLCCPTCRDPLSDAERTAPGRWRAEAPDVKGIRGYHVPWWPFPVVDLTALAVTAVSQDPSELTELYRSDLGLPYEASGSRVTEAMLSKLSADLPGGILPDGPWAEPTMGVDVGSRFHYRVTARDQYNRTCVLAMGSVGSWDALGVVMETHRVRQCIVDALPELHAAETWASQYPGRVLRAFYPQASAMNGQLFVVNAEKGIVQINRTMAMDRVYANVSTGKELWPSSVHNDPEVIAHMKAPVRVVALDARGQEQASWVHTSPDHLFHSCVYDTVARESLPGEVGVWIA